MSKDDLFASVWRGTAVSDDALTSCIQEPRRALEKTCVSIGNVRDIGDVALAVLSETVTSA